MIQICEKTEIGNTSDSIYEGTGRTMERYSYKEGELSSSINDGSNSIANTETEELDKNVYFEDEPEVFIIPIVESTAQVDPKETDEPEYDPYSDIPATETVAQITPVKEPEPVIEPNPVVVEQKNINVTTVKASNLEQGNYIQIATYSKMSNVNDVYGKYSGRYPMKRD